MDRFLSYTSTDFVYDEDFLYWVNHGKQHLLVDLRWRAWLAENPHKADEVDEARMLVLTIAQERLAPRTGFVRNQVWCRIEHTLRDNNEPIDQKPLLYRWYSKAAILILLLAAAGMIWAKRHARPPDDRATKVETGSTNTIIVRTSRVPRTIVLGDSTSIVLMPGSTLEYMRDFSDVYLAGEAFFEVSGDDNSPFVVRTSRMTVAALGTSFNVRSYVSENVTKVQVKSGRVSVSENDEPLRPSTVLLPNHQLVYDHIDQGMLRSLVEDPGILTPVAQVNFAFANAPMKDALAAIEAAYGIDIDFDESVFSSCFLDADLGDVPLYGKLKAICDQTGAAYEVVDSRIMLHGNGCVR